MRANDENTKKRMEAIDCIIDTLPAETYKHWIMRMFWGWFTSEESVGLTIEDHDMMCSTVKELMRFFDKVAEAEDPRCK